MLIDGNYTVGLLGGSFNPPHEGHIHISEQARKRYGLDKVWWLVTPGNPLKENSKLPPIDKRLKACRELTRGYGKIEVTGIERRLHTEYTAQTIKRLKQRFPHIHFVWLMGADNLKIFHQWQEWINLVNEVPVLVLDRDVSGKHGATYPALKSPAAQSLKHLRGDRWDYCFLPPHPASSTQLRGE